MSDLYPWLGDLYDVGLHKEWVGLICIFASMLCGGLVGIERERRDKPAGLRTVVLISVGSTIFTTVSLLLASGKMTADPARLAAQIIPGIGFLGAGAILHARGTVVGLTTGATIWAVAAVGVTIGAGYVAAGACFTLVIYFTLSILHRVEWILNGACTYRNTVVTYRPDAGKARPQIQDVLDHYRIPDGKVIDGRRGESERVLQFPVCTRHRYHRMILKDLSDIAAVTSLDIEGQAPRG